LPYFRLPGIENVERNDIVVFNWPKDTVYKFFDRSGRRADKPLDKKSNYVKRCVGIPGDSLQIIKGDVYVNGKILGLHDRQRLQFSYDVETDGSQFNEEYIFNELQITDRIRVNSQNSYTFSALTDENVARLRNNPMVKSVTKVIDNQGNKYVFPHTKDWNADNYGPIYIPQAGKTVSLTKETLPFYKEIITDYEKKELQVNGDEIRINGQVVNSYTFEMDYYWMMGDNRHNSEDSRYWGYVPSDHIVGKPVFIWMSLDQNVPWGQVLDKIRWERMFTTVGGSGEPVSYFVYFAIALLAWFGFDFYRKRKKKTEE
jgi:signal peptidase I